jgi:hypothetical protein
MKYCKSLPVATTLMATPARISPFFHAERVPEPGAVDVLTIDLNVLPQFNSAAVHKAAQ